MLSIGSLYQNFPNKDAILAELVRRHASDGVAALAEVPSDGPLDEVLRSVVEALAALHRGEQRLQGVGAVGRYPAQVRVLVTGSAGHLGEGLVRVLRGRGEQPVGLDVLPSPYTDIVASVTDTAAVQEAVRGCHAVLHAATLRKPHVLSHSRREFLDVNVAGTLTMLEAAVAEGVEAFVFSSSTMTFGRALSAPAGAPAAWIDETVRPAGKKIYGATKVAAEDLCELVNRDHGLPVLVLRTSRFFPEDDDREEVRSRWDGDELKLGELLHRRVDLEDAVEAHLLAVSRAPEIGFDRLVVSATTPFRREDAAELGVDAPAVLRRRVAGWEPVLAARGCRPPPVLDRVYHNRRAREVLRWAPRWTFAEAVSELAAGRPPRSALATAVGAKGYHTESFGVYTQR